MTAHKPIGVDEARKVGSWLGLDWAKIDLEQFRRGLEVELEHGSRDPQTNITNDDVTLTGKIAWAHLKEFPDYYTRLDRLEREAAAYWAGRDRQRAGPAGVPETSLGTDASGDSHPAFPTGGPEPSRSGTVNT